MKIEIFSDMVCPYCYIGKLRLNRAIEKTGFTNVNIRFRAFQLHPDSPSDRTLPVYDFFNIAYGPATLAERREILRPIIATGKSEGLDFNYDIMQSCNTQKAHRISKWAGKYGKQTEMVITIMDGYFTKGKKLNEDEVLLEMAAGLSLNIQEAKTILQSDQYLEDVKADIHEAHRLGISGVPYFIFDNKYAVSGAQPIEVFIKALHDTAKLTDKDSPDQSGDSQQCGVDGCL